MKVAERKQLLAKQATALNVEFSIDDELVALVLENTHASMPRAINSVLQCLTLIAGGTSLTASCKLTGIKQGRLNQWRSKEWYPRAIELIKTRLDEQLDGKFTHAINKGTNKLHQRLDIGDPVVNRDGTISYKPVSARDAAIITSIFFDKRNLLRNKPTHISSKVGVEERLADLTDRFKQIAIEAEYVEIESEPLERIEASTNGERIETQTNASITKQIGGELESSISKTKDKESDTSKWLLKDTSNQS